MAAKLSDDELRQRLLKLGISPGPITDSTRPLYLNKLRTFSSQGPRPPAANGVQPPPPEFKTQGQVPRRPQDRPKKTHVSTDAPSRPRPVQAVTAVQQASPPLPGSAQWTPSTSAGQEHGAQAVVTQLLSSLNDHAHLASDTAFLFPDGTTLLASRSIMAARCQQLVPLLYSREEPYPVNVSTLSGNVTQVFVRPSELVQDLKEKISLAQGTPMLEQRLVFMNAELGNERTLASCGVSAGATVHLVLVAPLTSPGTALTTYFTSMVSPSLSIAHLNLGVGLDRLTAPQASPHHHPPRVPLPPHITHIVHVYDVPSDGFRVFVRYLYSGQLSAEVTSTALACCVCCYVLAEAFRLPSLAQLSLQRVSSLLTVDSALLLVQFAEGVGAPGLRTVCTEYLKAQQNAQS